MNRFARICELLESGLPEAAKAEALGAYFGSLPEEDARLAAELLGSRARRSRLLAPGDLEEWARAESGLPSWLFDESVAGAGGDIAETAALLLGRPSPDEAPEGTSLRDWLHSRIPAFAESTDEERRALLARWWRESDVATIRVLHALLLGRAPARIAAATLDQAKALGFPLPPEMKGYAFAQPSSLPADARLEELGDCREWLAIAARLRGPRIQLLRRDARAQLWSSDRRFVTEAHREIALAASCLPEGTVLEGELHGPARFVAHDLLEHEGQAMGALPFAARLEKLRLLVPASSPYLGVAEAARADSWRVHEERRASCRADGARGLWLRHASNGAWHEWRHVPSAIDAVLLYAQGEEYTFGVWDHAARSLIAVVKATQHELNDSETEELDGWIQRHTRERFGPVRTVEPRLVFRIAYDEVAPAPRRKAGIELLNPRILAWRRDMPASEAARIASLLQLDLPL